MLNKTEDARTRNLRCCSFLSSAQDFTFWRLKSVTSLQKFKICLRFRLESQNTKRENRIYQQVILRTCPGTSFANEKTSHCHSFILSREARICVPPAETCQWDQYPIRMSRQDLMGLIVVDVFDSGENLPTIKFKTPQSKSKIDRHNTSEVSGTMLARIDRRLNSLRGIMTPSARVLSRSGFVRLVCRHTETVSP